MKTTILSCPQTEAMAARVAEVGGLRTGDISWETFRDGYPDMKIQAVEAIRNRDVAFLASFDTPGEIFRQLSLIYEVPRYAVRSFKVVLPYNPTCPAAAGWTAGGRSAFSPWIVPSPAS